MSKSLAHLNGSDVKLFPLSEKEIRRIDDLLNGSKGKDQYYDDLVLQYRDFNWEKYTLAVLQGIYKGEWTSNRVLKEHGVEHGMVNVGKYTKTLLISKLRERVLYTLQSIDEKKRQNNRDNLAKQGISISSSGPGFALKIEGKDVPLVFRDLNKAEKAKYNAERYIIGEDHDLHTFRTLANNSNMHPTVISTAIELIERERSSRGIIMF